MFDSTGKLPMEGMLTDYVPLVNIYYAAINIEKFSLSGKFAKIPSKHRGWGGAVSPSIPENS